MYLNQFSVRVPEGAERTSGYVEIDHGKQYTIVLRNDHSVRCNAEVSIDGKDIGTFRISANSTMRLERNPDDQGRFTFYKLGSSEATKSELQSVSVSDLGLLKVVFTPETKTVTTVSPCLPCHPRYGSPIAWADGGTTYDPNVWRDVTTCKGSSVSITAINYCAVQDNAPGGTGLSSCSDQGFIGVGNMCLDHSQQTTIHLRLICVSENSELRPLRPVTNSSPIPRPIV